MFIKVRRFEVLNRQSRYTPFIVNTDQIVTITQGADEYARCYRIDFNNTFMYVHSEDAQRVFEAIGVSL